jgi:hypothetical protein
MTSPTIEAQYHIIPPRGGPAFELVLVEGTGFTPNGSVVVHIAALGQLARTVSANANGTGELNCASGSPVFSVQPVSVQAYDVGSHQWSNQTSATWEPG